MTQNSLRCPICDGYFDGRLSTTMPFCSERCRLIDLGRWLSEDYSVPVERSSDGPDSDVENDPDWSLRANREGYDS
jgi:endogenous inhibitor of DNA gyrase (YacG/DUF329 family)